MGQAMEATNLAAKTRIKREKGGHDGTGREFQLRMGREIDANRNGLPMCRKKTKTTKRGGATTEFATAPQTLLTIPRSFVAPLPFKANYRRSGCIEPEFQSPKERGCRCASHRRNHSSNGYSTSRSHRTSFRWCESRTRESPCC